MQSRPTWHGGLVLEGVPREVHLDGEEFGVLHERRAFRVEGGETLHEPAQLKHDVL